MNKRGFFDDSLVFVSILFAFAVSIVIAYFLYATLADAFTSNPVIDPTEAARFQAGADRFPVVWDYGFLFVIICLFIGVMVLSYLLPSNPVFLLLGVLVVGFFGVMAAFLSNAWGALAETTLGNSMSNFPITSFIMNYYVLFIVIMVFLMVLVFYAKPEAA